MGLTLYIGKGCHQCQDVVEFVRANKVEHRLVHVHRSGEEPPIDTFIFPALFEEERLIAYGMDIVTHLNKRIEHPRSVGLMGKIRILRARIIGLFVK